MLSILAVLLFSISSCKKDNVEPQKSNTVNQLNIQKPSVNNKVEDFGPVPNPGGR